MRVVRLHDDQANKVAAALKENEGYCPCRLIKDATTICMCEEFRNQIADPSYYGKCHCGLYEKVV